MDAYPVAMQRDHQIFIIEHRPYAKEAILKPNRPKHDVAAARRFPANRGQVDSSDYSVVGKVLNHVQIDKFSREFEHVRSDCNLPPNSLETAGSGGNDS